MGGAPLYFADGGRHGRQLLSGSQICQRLTFRAVAVLPGAGGTSDANRLASPAFPFGFERNGPKCGGQRIRVCRQNQFRRAVLAGASHFSPSRIEVVCQPSRRKPPRRHPSRKRQRSTPVLSGIQGMGQTAAEPSFSFLPLEFWRVGGPRRRWPRWRAKRTGQRAIYVAGASRTSQAVAFAALTFGEVAAESPVAGVASQFSRHVSERRGSARQAARKCVFPTAANFPPRPRPFAPGRAAGWGGNGDRVCVVIVGFPLAGKIITPVERQQTPPIPPLPAAGLFWAAGQRLLFLCGKKTAC